MILLITTSACGQECVAAMNKACEQDVHLTTTVRDALSCVHANEYNAVVIDQNVLESDPLAIETVIRNARLAVPVYVNFALQGRDRVVRDTQMSLRRAQAERLIAMRAASDMLQSKLNGTVAGILLSSELTLSVPGLPSAAEVKIRFIHELAKSLRRQLEEHGQKETASIQWRRSRVPLHGAGKRTRSDGGQRAEEHI